MPEDPNTPSTNESTPASITEPSVAESQPTTTESIAGEQPVVSQPITSVKPASSKTSVFSHKKKLSLAVILVIGFVIFVGGSAGAYYGVIEPNKPVNILKTAFKNTLLQKKVKFNGKISTENTEAGASIKAINVTVAGQADLEKSAFAASAEVTASGVKVPFEVRGIDNNLYLKIGDLSNVKSVASLASPEIAPIIDALNQKIANNWIEFDETLLKQAGANCTVNSNYSLTPADIDLLTKRYESVPFASVKTSNDTVDGKPAIKYDISIDDNKGAEYVKGLSELPIVKNLRTCGSSNSLDTTSLADGDITPITLWVSKGNKQIVKIAGQTTAKDEQKNHMKASFEITMQYGQATVDKPENAIPFTQLIGSLDSLLGSNPLTQTLGVSTEKL